MSKAAVAHSCPPAIPHDAHLEHKVEEKLKQLSLEEKIGQMCELAIEVVTDWKSTDKFQLDTEAVNKIIRQYKVGSILQSPLQVCQAPEVWAKLVRELNTASFESCHEVTQVYGVDQIHGTTYTRGGTLFPQEINQGASFNVAIPHRIAEICAYETRACLLPWIYSPALDLGRNQMWSRLWESFGEDVLVNAEMGAATVRGFQGSDPNHIGMNNVACTAKHFMAYGAPSNGKDRTPSMVTNREMREKFFEPFRRCIEAGALSVMASSSVNNGIPFHANALFLQKWLKDELNWDGLVVSDWADVKNAFDRDHMVDSYKDAIELCVNAGVDMTMEALDVSFCDLLLELVREGRVTMERVDDAVRRVLRMKYRLGLMDRKTWDLPYEEVKAKYPKFACEEFANEAIHIAEECIVLLKNSPAVKGGKPLLPLNKDAKILVCGPNADSFRGMCGGWTCSWQGHVAEEVLREQNKYQYHSFYEGLRNKLGSDKVKLVAGVEYVRNTSQKVEPIDENVLKNKSGWEEETQLDAKAVVEASKDVDVIVVCVGENSYCETLGNITELALSSQQQELVKAIGTTGKPIILVLTGGRPRIIRDIEHLSVATINTSLPGPYGGVALANLLVGDANFSARLPFTYPKHPGSLETYDYKPCQNRAVMEGSYNYDAVMDVLYPFGFGLSYTHYQYSNLSVDKKTFKAADTLTFTVDVKNAGSRAGKEAVLLFASDLAASVSPDVRRLRAFTKISLASGESTHVTLTVKASDLAFVGIDEHWVLEKGAFVVTCGGQHLEVLCEETKRWDTPNRT